MQIALETLSSEVNQIRSYQQGSIQVNDKIYDQSIIIAPKAPVKLWAPQSYAELKVEHLSCVAEFKPQIILFGTGYKMLFPGPEIRLVIQKLQLGVEFMDTAAACRTYNILLAEDRNVVAALLIA